MVFENKILKLCQYIFAVSLLSPFGKHRGLSFEQTWIPFTKWWFACQVWLKLAPWFWRRDKNVKSLRTDGWRRQAIRKVSSDELTNTMVYEKSTCSKRLVDSSTYRSCLLWSKNRRSRMQRKEQWWRRKHKYQTVSRIHYRTGRPSILLYKIRWSRISRTTP